MKKIIKSKSKINLVILIRKIGYYPKSSNITPDGVREISCWRRLTSSDYPHFHLFVKEINQNKIILSLHLDQKKPSYSMSPAHSGEYNTSLIKKEMERITDIISTEL